MVPPPKGGESVQTEGEEDVEKVLQLDWFMSIVLTTWINIKLVRTHVCELKNKTFRFQL